MQDEAGSSETFVKLIDYTCVYMCVLLITSSFILSNTSVTILQFSFSRADKQKSPADLEKRQAEEDHLLTSWY